MPALIGWHHSSSMLWKSETKTIFQANQSMFQLIGDIQYLSIDW